VCTAALCLLTTAARAQEPQSLTYGAVAHLHSAVLGEDRRFNIYVPPYFPDSTRFDVVYLLDGSAHEDYLHVIGIVDYLQTYGVIPPTMVVGLSNVDRRRDFTRASDSAEDRKSAPTAGGADAFVRFLGEEAIPYVGAHYHVTGTRTLIGQSLGGLVATQVLLEKADLFTRYLIVSPSLWWDSQKLAHAAPALLKAHPAPGHAVFLALSNEGDQMRTADTTLDAQLGAAGWPGLRHVFRYYPDETHATDLHISVYDGLKFLAGPAAK
jgi:predicted alpha/beta superfamily hydrolase